MRMDLSGCVWGKKANVESRTMDDRLALAALNENPTKNLNYMFIHFSVMFVYFTHGDDNRVCVSFVCVARLQAWLALNYLTDIICK